MSATFTETVTEADVVVGLARGGEPRVRHVRCVQEGDAFCEWALSWE